MIPKSQAKLIFSLTGIDAYVPQFNLSLPTVDNNSVCTITPSKTRPSTSRVILILMKFRILILACCQVVLTASLVSELFLFSL